MPKDSGKKTNAVKCPADKGMPRNGGSATKATPSVSPTKSINYSGKIVGSR